MNIGFNKPYFTGKETEYILEAVKREKISGNGYFTNKCHHFFQERYGFKKVLLTTSCTDALEMAALLLEIDPGDEVIMPSFTFVSTANAFVLRGAKIVFADSSDLNPNIDLEKIEQIITKKTKAIVVVHYAGVACDMDKALELAEKHNLFIVEDAAQAIDSYYKGKPLGSIGHLGCFSFHETKNIISGEGGMLVINDERFMQRAEIIWEKGTNRAAFFRGEVDKYSWIDVGSSFLPSEIIAACLFAQLECLETIQATRKSIWNYYYNYLRTLEIEKLCTLPFIPDYATNNGHIFYLVAKNQVQRDRLLDYLNNRGINAIFHYLSLHSSKFSIKKYKEKPLAFSDNYANCLIRLPLYINLTKGEQNFIIQTITNFFI
jgi:dTDP-4-amino-4,6-dideoxygalactose transaminase